MSLEDTGNFKFITTNKEYVRSKFIQPFDYAYVDFIIEMTVVGTFNISVESKANISGEIVRRVKKKQVRVRVSHA